MRTLSGTYVSEGHFFQWLKDTGAVGSDFSLVQANIQFNMSRNWFEDAASPLYYDNFLEVLTRIADFKYAAQASSKKDCATLGLRCRKLFALILQAKRKAAK